MTLSLAIAIISVCLVCEAFSSGSEIAVISADRALLRHKAANGSKGAALALKMLDNPEWLLSTTLVGTNISVVTSSTVATAVVISHYGEGSAWMAAVLVAPFVWVFGEIIPKSVFQQQANVITPIAIYPLRMMSIAFWPILIVFGTLSRWAGKAMGSSDDSGNPFTLREQIFAMMQMPPAARGHIEPDEQSMIRRVFDFQETTARDVMVPLIDVVMIECRATCGEAVQLASEKAHSRLPVYDGRVDKVVGLLPVLELLAVSPELPIKDWIREIDYIPTVKSVHELLTDMRERAQVVAVVVDEFGGAEGIVTIEDIVEEIVEEIEDEYDVEETPMRFMRKLGERDYMVSARVDVATINEALDLQLPAGDYSSLAGFLLTMARDVPETGAVIQYKGIEFTIKHASPQAIVDVRIRW